MKTLDKRAVDLFNALPIDHKANMFKCCETIKTALKEQDKITRHACAENVGNKLTLSLHENALLDAVKSIIINTKTL